MHHLKEQLDIKHILCANYSPQSNGALERSHCRIKEYLSFYVTVEGTSNDWDIFLSHAKSAFNKSIHSSTGYSPHELVFGEKPRLPIDEQNLGLSYEQLHYRLCDNIRNLHDLARDNQITKKLRTKEIYDRKSRPVYFKVDDLVLVKDDTKV